ncbi:MAG: hypothetical protein IJQ12_01430 [Lachnospiraceae bacterium]|nr:hypothetical protein [Lachnospiraceae bacterium]
MLRRERDSIILDAQCALRIDRDIYFFAKSANALYVYNIDENRTRLLSAIPGKDCFDKMMVSKILLYKDDLILIPCFGHSVWTYNLLIQKWREIRINISNNKGIVSMQSFVWQDRIHIIGCNNPFSVVFDMKLNEAFYCHQPYDILKDKMTNDTFFHSEYIKKNTHTVVMGCCCANWLMEYNLDSGKGTLVNTGVEISDVEGIAIWGDERIIAARTTHAVKYFRDGLWKDVALPQDLLFVYLASVKYHENIMLLGKERGASLVFRDGELVETIDRAFYFCEKSDVGFITMDTNNQLIIVDKNTERTGECRISLDEFFNMTGELMTGYIIYENESVMTIRDMIDTILK